LTRRVVWSLGWAGVEQHVGCMYRDQERLRLVHRSDEALVVTPLFVTPVPIGAREGANRRDRDPQRK